MMSKNSFWKSSKWNLRNRQSSCIINFIIWFILFPTIALLALIVSRNDAYAMDSFRLGGLVTGQIVASVFTSVFVGVGMAIEAFGWMNNLSQVDMYKSVPVKESARFNYINLNSLIIYAVTFVINVILEILVINIFYETNGRIIIMMTYMILFNIAVFMSSYAISVIAVLLTGNSVLAALGAIFLNFLEISARLLWSLGKYTFYRGYYVSNYPGVEFFEGILTPACMAARGIDIISGLVDATGSIFASKIYEAYLWIIPVVIQAGVYILLAYLLYRRRPAGTSGNRIIFRAARPVIEISICVLGGFAVALLLSSIGGRKVGITGMIIIIFFMHIILKMIMDGQVRMHRAGAAVLVLSLAITGGSYSYLAFDLGGFDRYAPSERELEGYSVMFPKDYAYTFYASGAPIANQIGEDVLLNDMKITDENAKKTLLDNIRGINSSKEDGHYSITVKYYLENGKTAMRRYYMSEDAARNIYMATYETPEYRKVVNTLSYHRSLVDKYIDIKPASVNVSLDIINQRESSGNISESKDVYKRLYEAAQEDEAKRSADMVTSVAPIGTLLFDMTIDMDEGADSYMYLTAPLYSQDENTITVLEELGWDMQPDEEYPVQHLEVYSTVYEDEGNYEAQDYVLIDDEDEIREVMESAVSGEAIDAARNDFFTDKNYHVYSYYNSMGSMNEGDIYFYRGRVPQVIKDKF